MLKRLDRLIQDEAHFTAAQSLKVVYGLIQNMRVVIDGEQSHLVPHIYVVNTIGRGYLSGSMWV